jgi:hypothetical protein
MGGGFIGARALLCAGDEVLKELKRVFGHPGTQAYRDAQSQKQLFYDVANGPYAGRWKDLHDAYLAAGVADSLNWPVYLQTLGAANIIMIAQARYDGLSRGKPMQTKTHDPGSEHKVHRKNVPDGSIEIDSPFKADPGCP